jgi:hypothetical protein
MIFSRQYTSEENRKVILEPRGAVEFVRRRLVFLIDC